MPPDQQLIAYLRTNLEKGYSQEQLLNNLTKNGYAAKDVQEGLRTATNHINIKAGEKKVKTGKIILIAAGIVLIIIIGAIIAITQQEPITKSNQTESIEELTDLPPPPPPPGQAMQQEEEPPVNETANPIVNETAEETEEPPAEENTSACTQLYNTSDATTTGGYQVRLQEAGLRYSIQHQGDGILYATIEADQESYIVGEDRQYYTFFLPLKEQRFFPLNNHYAIKAINSSQERLSITNTKETVVFSLLNRSVLGCSEEVATKPVVSVWCSNRRGNGDCIADEYDYLNIDLGINLIEADNEAEASFTIDTGEPFFLDERYDNPLQASRTIYGDVRLPSETMDPGTHTLTITVKTNGEIYTYEEPLIILNDNELALRLYEKTSPTSAEDHLLVFEEENEGQIVLKHNANKDRLILTPGNCVIMPGEDEISICYPSKIITNNQATPIFTLKNYEPYLNDNTKDDTKCDYNLTVDVGDDFEIGNDRFDVLQTYTIPRVVAIDWHQSGTKKVVRNYFGYERTHQWPYPFEIIKANSREITITYQDNC